MLQHLADSDDDEVGLGLVALTVTRSLILTLSLTLIPTLILTPNEAAEAFGVVSSRTLGSTRAARALYISPRSPLYLP